MARRFSLEKVGHSAAVFDTAKLAWMNRHYMKEADPGRLAVQALPYFIRAGYVSAADGVTCEFVQSLLPLAIGSTDRIEEIPNVSRSFLTGT
jgi:glutamyl/glutaminyl-tRNA synthetase